MDSKQYENTTVTHNNNAEKTTLGTLILKPDMIDTVIAILKSKDFYSKSHRLIFKAIVNLTKSAESVDLITLTEKLRDTGRLKQCGGSAYISTLIDNVPTSANAEYYAKIVHDCSKRRKLIKTASKIMKDANDETKNEKLIIEETVKKLSKIAEPRNTYTFKYADELIKKSIETMEKICSTREVLTGIPSGYPELDYMTKGFQKSDLIIIGGRPSGGRTALALTIAANIAVNQNICTGFLSLDSSAEDLMQRILASEARVSINQLRDSKFKVSDLNSIQAAAPKLYDSPIIIEDPPYIKLHNLCEIARTMKSQHDIKILFIDNIDLIGPDEKNKTSRYEHIIEISRSLKALARELDIPVICLSQINPRAEYCDLQLSDWPENMVISGYADVIMIIELKQERTPEAIKAELILYKNRIGHVGKQELLYFPSYIRFESKLL